MTPGRFHAETGGPIVIPGGATRDIPARNPISARDEATVAALARALVRTGMYIDAGIDTSAGLDAPRVYAMALLTDPLLAEDGVHFISILRDDGYEGWPIRMIPEAEE